MLIYSLINKYVLWSLISPLQPAPADSSREKERFLAPRLPSRGSHGAGGLCVRPAGPPAERVVSPVVQKWHLLRLGPAAFLWRGPHSFCVSSRRVAVPLIAGGCLA